MDKRDLYGLEIREHIEGIYAYRITIDETGVWLKLVAEFESDEKETAHAFIRAWNGEGSPS